MPVHGGVWKNFLSWVCLRCSHLEKWHSIPLRPGIWQSLPRRLGVACGVLDSSGDDFGCSAKLGSTMVTCSASALGCGELRIFSTLPWTRILKCLVFVLTQCSVDASVSVLVALLAPGNLEVGRAHHASDELLKISPSDSLQRRCSLWPYTSIIQTRVQKNNNNNNNRRLTPACPLLLHHLF